jgi:tRNA threonylcarbamoyladenosine biosynthesis protein TsaE
VWPVLQVHWNSEEDTLAFASRLATCPALAHATLTLHGDLGAGKTTLVRHLLRALGVQGRIKSPTYAVVEPHSSIDCPFMPDGEVLHIWHFDFYRFSDPREWHDAGFRDIFASPGLKLAEWPEKAAGCVPLADLALQLDVQDEAALQFRLTAQTRLGTKLLDGLGPPCRNTVGP